MSNILRVDEKWSIEYDPAENDQPVAWYRHGEKHSYFDENNAVVALFYTLLEEKKKTENLITTLKQSREDFYEASNRFQDEDYQGPIPRLTVDAVCHAKPYFDLHMKHLRDSAQRVDDILKKLEK